MIELKNITYIVKENGKDKLVLDNISCVFPDKCLTVITGQNGSGKSTLTKIIMGIVKATSGSVLYNGEDITNLKINERANLGINYAFQQPVGFQGITVKELIDIATHKENNFSHACDYLAKVGICAKEYINREFNKTLSGGEQKRVELALALAKKGDCLIFDEPEAGIDLWSFEKLIDLFDKSKCNIIVSHQQKVLETADKIMVLNQGKIEMFGDKLQVLKKLNLSKCSKLKGGRDEIR